MSSPGSSLIRRVAAGAVPNSTGRGAEDASKKNETTGGGRKSSTARGVNASPGGGGGGGSGGGTSALGGGGGAGKVVPDDLGDASLRAGQFGFPAAGAGGGGGETAVVRLFASSPLPLGSSSVPEKEVRPAGGRVRRARVRKERSGTVEKGSDAARLGGRDVDGEGEGGGEGEADRVGRVTESGDDERESTPTSEPDTVRK